MCFCTFPGKVLSSFLKGQEEIGGEGWGVRGEPQRKKLIIVDWVCKKTGQLVCQCVCWEVVWREIGPWETELCSSSLLEKNRQGKKTEGKGMISFFCEVDISGSGFLLSWRNCFTFPDCVYFLQSTHRIPGTKQNEWEQKSVWMMRDGSPTCWSGVWVVTFFEYMVPSYLKLKNFQVFGKEQKHVSNWVLERGLPKVTLVKEITSSPSYTMYFWWHHSWCGQWLYHPVMTSCTCPSFCYQNASALQQGLEWDT